MFEIPLKHKSFLNIDLEEINNSSPNAHFRFSHFVLGNRNFFLKQKLEDISPFSGTLIPLFWTSGDVYCEFQSQSRQPYLHLVEAYIIYVP